MSKSGKWGFGLPKGMVGRFRLTERVGSFLDAIRSADQKIMAGVYERGLLLRLSKTPGKWSFGYLKEWFERFRYNRKIKSAGALESRKDSLYSERNLANLFKRC